MNAPQATIPGTATPARRCALESRPNPAGETIHLQDKQHMKLCGAAGWSVKALAGSVWVTQNGDIRDIVLQAGDSVVLDRDGLALFSAFGSASFTLYRDLGRTERQPRRHSLTKPFSSVATHGSLA